MNHQGCVGSHPSPDLTNRLRLRQLRRAPLRGILGVETRIRRQQETGWRGNAPPRTALGAGGINSIASYNRQPLPTGPLTSPQLLQMHESARPTHSGQPLRPPGPLFHRLARNHLHKCRPRIRARVFAAGPGISTIFSEPSRAD